MLSQVNPLEMFRFIKSFCVENNNKNQAKATQTADLETKASFNLPDHLVDKSLIFHLRRIGTLRGAQLRSCKNVLGKVEEGGVVLLNRWDVAGFSGDFLRIL